MARKKAFLVGINNYANPKCALKGCIPDIDSLSSLLINSFGFSSGDISRLVDAGAKKPDIVTGLSNLLSGAAAGDTLVFAFSGHGCLKPATAPGTQPNDMSNAIVPYESTYASLLTDEELFNVITSVVTTPAIKFTAIYDCCHSGTMVRDIQFDPKNGELVTMVENRCMLVPDLLNVPRRAVGIAPYNAYSACADQETAADLRSVPGETEPRGAFSYAVHKLLRGGSMTIAQLDTQTKPLIQTVSPHQQTPEFYAVDPSSPVFG
jgi:hypothetical protein